MQESFIQNDQFSFLFCVPHCPKDIQNLRIKAEPFTAGADAKSYVRLLFYLLYIWPRSQTYTVASALTVTG